MKSWKNIEARKEPVKLIHYNIEFQGNTTAKSTKKKEYEYYLCDYCKEKIKIEKNIDKRTGGIVEISITTNKSIKLALHNKCIKAAIKEINEEYGLNI